MGVVGDDAEARVGGVLFHYAPQGHLSGRGHGVRFVEDDEFVGAKSRGVAGFGQSGEDLFRALKG